MSTTARRCSSTASAPPTSWPARPAASPSTSAPTRSSGDGHHRVHRHPGPRGLHGHARPRCQGDRHRGPRGGGRRRRHAPDRRGHQPRQGRRRPDHRRRQQDRPGRRGPRPGARSSCPSTAWFPRTGAATPSASRCPPCSRSASTTCSSRSCSSPRSRSSRPTPKAGPGRRHRGRTWTSAAARWPRSSSSRARCGSVTRSSPVRRGARSRPSSTTTASRSRRRSLDAGPGARLLRGADGRRRVARGPGPGHGPHDRRGPRAALPVPGTRRRLGRGGAKLEDLFEQIQRGETATLNLILKADVQGSLEASPRACASSSATT